MATTISSYPTNRQTVEVKTGSSGSDATIQSTSGLVVLQAGAQATFIVPAKQPTPASAPVPDNSELAFLNADGQAYTVNFPDGKVLTFSGVQREMATVVLFQGTYNLKSASNTNIRFQ